MLTGRKAFEGETVSDTLAAVLMREPDWSALPAGTPPAVRRVLKRCLDRNPKTRFHDVADARLEMDETIETSVPPAVPAAASSARRGGAAWVAAAVFAIAAGLGWWRALTAPSPASPLRTAFAISVPAADNFASDDTPVLAVSRDGRRLVYAAERAGARQLFLRTLGELETRPLEGTTGARGPFFSPDGEWIGFFAEGGKLKKVPVAGGPAQTILEGITAQRGGTWADDDTIVLTADYAAGLSRVSARGGRLEPLTKVDAAKGDRTHRWPEALPGGDAVLFTIGSTKSVGNYDDAKIAVLDRKTREVRILLEGGSMARFCPPNHLLYVRSRAVLAIPFDVKRRQITGEPFPISEKIAGDPSSGIAYFAVSGAGSLAYFPGATETVENKLVVTDRKGTLTELPLPPREYRFPRFSPDGSRIAFSIGSGRGVDDEVWVYQLGSGALTRMTFNGGNFNPMWSTDGKRLAYVSARAKNEGLYSRPADGSGTEQWIYGDFTARMPSDFSADGKTLLFTHPSNQLWVTRLSEAPSTADGSSGVSHMLALEGYAGVFSPDGRYIAYSAAVGGAVAEIFVQSADESGAKWQLTTDGGWLPVWVGNEIVYLKGGQVRSVEVRTQPVFQSGPPRTLFEGQFDIRTVPLRNYDVSRDGQRFVFVRGSSELTAREVDVILNWSRDLGTRK
jgi:serine/threonine-protein kinase